MTWKAFLVQRIAGAAARHPGLRRVGARMLPPALKRTLKQALAHDRSVAELRVLASAAPREEQLLSADARRVLRDLRRAMEIVEHGADRPPGKR